jgi:hypothetical protein
MKKIDLVINAIVVGFITAVILCMIFRFDFVSYLFLTEFAVFSILTFVTTSVRNNKKKV